MRSQPNTIRLETAQVPEPAFSRITEAAIMTLRYAVGIKIGNRADQMTVEAEDALIAALKVKTTHPEATVTYVRKRNARGDQRHPHSRQIGKDPAEHAERTALPTSSDRGITSSASRAGAAASASSHPDGGAIVPTMKPQPDGALVKALARAHRWKRLLDAGVQRSVTEIAEAEGPGP